MEGTRRTRVPEKPGVARIIRSELIDHAPRARKFGDFTWVDEKGIFYKEMTKEEREKEGYDSTNPRATRLWVKLPSSESDHRVFGERAKLTGKSGELKSCIIVDFFVMPRRVTGEASVIFQ